MPTIGAMIDTVVTDWKYIPFAQDKGKLLDKTIKMLSSSLDSLMFYNAITSPSACGSAEGLKKPFKAINELYKWNEIGLLIQRLTESYFSKVEAYQKKHDDKASKPNFFLDLSWTDRALVIGQSFTGLESLQNLDFIRLSSISIALGNIPGWKSISEKIAFSTVKEFSFLCATSLTLYADVTKLYHFKTSTSEDVKAKKESSDKLIELRLSVVGNIAKAALLSLGLILNSTSYRVAYLVVTSVDLKDLKQPIALIGAVAGAWSAGRKDRLESEKK